MTATVAQVHATLSKLLVKGCGDWPVQLLRVEGGVPFAVDVTIEKAERYDGERVWIHAQEDEGSLHPPEWTGKAKL